MLVLEHLKNKLLENSLFIDNDYLVQYIQLVSLNIHTRYAKGTQAHHIIPKAYFTYVGEDIDNTADNIINLLYKDHVKAHWLLYNCTTGQLKKANGMAVRKMINCLPVTELTDDEYNMIQQYYLSTCVFIEEQALYELYINKGLSREQIATLYQCSVSEVKKFLSKYKILKNNFLTIEKVELEHLLLEEKLPRTAIAKKFNISISKLNSIINNFGIHAQYRSDALFNIVPFEDVKAKLALGWKLSAIADHYNINRNRLYTAVRKENIKYENNTF